MIQKDETLTRLRPGTSPGRERVQGDSLIERPSIGQILTIERQLRGERREMFQEAFDVLHQASSDDYALTGEDVMTRWRIENLGNLLRGFERVNRESRDRHSRPAGVLRARLRHRPTEDIPPHPGPLPRGEREEYDLGLVSVNVVTDVGVAYIIDALQNLVEPENLKYHGSGTNSAAEAVGDTALGAEVGSRVAGTQVEGASANIYKTVATISYGSSLTITEHGLFSASTGGTLFDRSVFAGIAVDTSTSIEFTYEWTLNAGG